MCHPLLTTQCRSVRCSRGVVLEAPLKGGVYFVLMLCSQCFVFVFFWDEFLNSYPFLAVSEQELVHPPYEQYLSVYCCVWIGTPVSWQTTCCESRRVCPAAQCWVIVPGDVSAAAFSEDLWANLCFYSCKTNLSQIPSAWIQSSVFIHEDSSCWSRAVLSVCGFKHRIPM